jgi:hypothetical protein
MDNTPRSNASILLYNKMNIQSPKSKIVIRPKNVSTLLWHECTDIDFEIPKDVISDDNWNDFKYCDYKLYISVTNTEVNAQFTILKKFLLNNQPFKILHVSLDDRKINAFNLLKQLGSLEWTGELGVEINDRTETLTSLNEIRKITDFFLIDKIISLDYLNARYDHTEAFWVDLKDPNSQIVHYLRLVTTH